MQSAVSSDPLVESTLAAVSRYSRTAIERVDVADIDRGMARLESDE
jgi:hypothetical protein